MEEKDRLIKCEKLLKKAYGYLEVRSISPDLTDKIEEYFSEIN